MSEKKQQTAYPLRMPEALREQLEDAAATNKRSLNAELIARLEESFGPHAVDINTPLYIKGSTGEPLPPLEKLLSAASHQFERMAFVHRQIEQIKSRTMELEDELQRAISNASQQADPLEKELLRHKQFQITSEISAFRMQLHMLEFELSSAESATNIRVGAPPDAESTDS